MQINIALTLTLPEDKEKLRALNDIMSLSQAEVEKLTSGKDVAETPGKAKRAAKTAPEAPAPAAEAPAAAPEKAEPTEKEQKKSAQDTTEIAKMLVAKFNKPMLPDNKPEGFHMAKKLLIDHFKVGRLSDLTHEQRLEFIVKVRAMIQAEPAAV